MTEPKKPLIGEKPYCKIHNKHIVEYVCTARECSYRVLCNECLGEHERMSFNHKALVMKLNDWLKGFNSIARLYAPEENHSLIFLLDQITQSLKKQQEELNKSEAHMKETFQRALNQFFTFFSSLNDEMSAILWKRQKIQDSALEKLKKSLDRISYKNCKDEIYKLMKTELSSHFQNGKLNEFYTKVYNGEYSNQVFNNHGSVESVKSELRVLRDDIDEGFRRFDHKKFEEVWHSELEQLKSRLTDNFFKGIFQRVELDLFNPRSPKVRVVEDVPGFEQVDKLPKVICTSTLQTPASSLCGSLSHDIFLTASTNKFFKIWDASHNYRELNEIKATDDEEVRIKSLCILNYHQKDANQLHHFVVLGGDVETPHLEIWDYGANKFQLLIEDAHEDGISCIQEVKSEYAIHDDSCKYYLATAACDNLIKIWTLTVVRNANSEFDISLTLFKESVVHDDFISCVVSLPNCGVLEGSMVISGSHDRSVNFWQWEEDVTGLKCGINGQQKLLGEEESKGKGKLVINGDHQGGDNEYQFKMKWAHSDFVKAILLLYDRADYSDLEFFATGGGDNMIKIWSLREKKLLKAFTNNKRSVAKMAYLGNGKIASSANEKQIKEFFVYIWDWQKSQLQAVLKGHKFLIQNVSTLPDGTFLTSDNKSIKIWKLEYDEQQESPQLEHSQPALNSQGSQNSPKDTK